MKKLTAAVGGWLLRQQGWHLALSLWIMFCPVLLGVEVGVVVVEAGSAHHPLHVSQLLLAVAIGLVVSAVIAVGLAGYLRRGWRASGWDKSGNDG